MKKITPPESGRIKWFNPEKGYGLLISENEDELFFQIRHISTEVFFDYKPGQLVEFSRLRTIKGIEATQLKLI